MTMPLWLWEGDPEIEGQYDREFQSNWSIGLLNDTEVRRAEQALEAEQDISDAENVLLPAGYPPLRLLLPASFTADYIKLGRYRICSARMRDILAQPQGVVQYWPTEVERTGVATAENLYFWMRVIPAQPAIDFERSECGVQDWVDRKTGEITRWAVDITRIVLRADLTPHTDLFRIAESALRVLTTEFAGRQDFAVGMRRNGIQGSGKPAPGKGNSGASGR